MVHTRYQVHIYDRKRTETSKRRKKRKTAENKLESGRRPSPEGTKLLFAGAISPMMHPGDGATEGRHDKIRRETRQDKKERGR